MGSEFVRVASTIRVPIGALKAVTVGINPVVLANVEGKYYAIGRICTHAGCDISGGTLEGEIITCPCHGSEWNVQSGKAKFMVPLPSVPLFDVKVDGTDILLRKRE